MKQLKTKDATQMKNFMNVAKRQTRTPVETMKALTQVREV